ncbi:MAG TPA: serine/threonine-protein kinase [Terriglobales bacterium]|nr:serine/threonine-protein kinase [Terriglobales bacterium]
MASEAARQQWTPEGWQHARVLLATLIELPPEQRAAFLESSCSDDANLRLHLEDLLRAHEATEAQHFEKFSEELGSNLAAAGFVQPVIGRRIGAYRVEAEIGHGGMGSVYRAVRADEAYEKRVAIKLVDRGLSRRSAELFRHERQILANLEHPNIARLLDGGTHEDGSPYLVMEFVEGETITRYCDSHRLSIEQRLALFQKICSAVHFAHQNLVIHRDIKPANILVTPEGEPKLLDFGIAKIVGNDAETQTMGAMTPAYASPEQLRGELVTTATDGYSLGLVLYELLTGRYAYERFTSPARRQQAILQDDLERPSQAVKRASSDQSLLSIGALRQLTMEKLAQRLGGDLESIVAKATAKSPEARYSSVAQFSEDIARHLRGEAVIAHQNTLVYRWVKFVRRHRAGAAAAVLVCLLFMVGLALVVRADRKAEAERAMAERRFDDLRSLASSLMFEIHDSIRDLPGATPARKLVVSKALQYLDTLSKDASTDLSLQRELATAYQRIGDVQGGSTDANLGDTQGAIESYRKSLQIRESIARMRPHDPQAKEELADIYDRVGSMAANARDYPQALASYGKSLELLQQLPNAKTNPRILNQVAGDYYYLGMALSDSGDSAGAVENELRSISIRESLKPKDARARQATQLRLAGSYGTVAQMLRDQRDFDRALRYQRKAVSTISELAASEPQNQTYLRYLGQGNMYLGRILNEMGDPRGALTAYRKGALTLESIRRADPLNDSVLQDLAYFYAQLGELEINEGEVSSGVKHLRSATSTWDKEVRNDSSDKSAIAARGEVYLEAGRAYSTLALRSKSLAQTRQLWQQARTNLHESMKMWKQLESQHAVISNERDAPQATAKALAKCERALAQLSRGK